MYLEFCFHHAQFYLQNPNPFLKPLPFLVFLNPKESNRFLKYKQVSFPFFLFFVASCYFLMHPFSFHCSRFDAVLICFSGSDLGDIHNYAQKRNFSNFVAFSEFINLIIQYCYYYLTLAFSFNPNGSF